MPTADLGTSFPGMDAGTNQEVIQSNNLLYGSLLNLADAYEKAGKDASIFSSQLETASKMATKTADDCKAMADELGKLSIVNIDGELFSFKGVDSNELTKTIDKVNKQLETTKQKLNAVSKSSEKAGKWGKSSGKQTEKTWQDTADGIGNSADKAIMAIDSVSGAFGGASSGLSGVVGDVVQLIKNPMTAAIAGAGVALLGLVEIGKQLWDEWNESIEEAKAKSDFLIQVASDKKNRTTTELQENEGYFDQLKELSKDGLTNHMEIAMASKAIDVLIEKLVKLGHVEDELRRKIKIHDGQVLGLDDLERLLESGATQEKIDAAKKLIEEQLVGANNSFKNAAKSLAGWSFFATDAETADTVSKVSHAEDLLKFRFSAKETTTHASQYGVTQLKRDKDQVEFEKAWNRLMDESDLQGVMDLIAKKLKTVKTQSAIDELTNLHNALKVLVDTQDELNTLNEEGVSSTKDIMAKYAKYAKQVEQKANQAEKSKKEAYEKRLAESREKERTANFTIVENYTDAKKQKNATANQIAKTNVELTALNGKIVQSKNHLDELAKKANEGKIIDVVQLSQATQKYQELLDKRISMENKIVDLKTKQLELSEQIAKIERDAQKYTETKLKNDQSNRRLQYFSAKGDWGKYNEEKLRIEIENSGQHLTDKQKKDLAKNQQYNNNVAVWGKFNEQFKKLYSQALKVNSPSQAAKQGMIDEFSKLKGGDLSKGQLSMIDRLVQLQTKLTNLPKLDLSNAQIKTNELTSRGGWKGGAVAPDVNRVNQLIASNTQTANGILAQIKQVLSNGLKV